MSLSIEKTTCHLEQPIREPILALAEVLREDYRYLEKHYITHPDHFVATLRRGLKVARNDDDIIIFSACALTHDLCRKQRIFSKDSDDELKRRAFRWYHMADGAARGTDAIIEAKRPQLLEHADTISIINGLHDAGSARATIVLSPKDLHRRFIEFASLDTLGMIACPADGIYDGPYHSIFQTQDGTPDVASELDKNTRSLRKRQTALLGLKSVPENLVDCFPCEALKELTAEYIRAWKDRGIHLA